MKYFYSASTGGAYMDEIHATMPDDVVEMTKELYTSLYLTTINGSIGPDENGQPCVIPFPVVEPDYPAIERFWRDAKLASTDALVARHRDEVEADEGTTLTAVQYKALQAYRTALRNWTSSVDFPDSTKRPSEPSWLESQIEL